MEYYIELPDMNLESQELSGLYLSKFHICSLDEKGNIVPSTINLKNTKATVNINGIGPNDVQKDENNIQNYITDFSKANFIGCDVIGRLPDEIDEIQNPNYKISEYKKGNTDEIMHDYLTAEGGYGPDRIRNISFLLNIPREEATKYVDELKRRYDCESEDEILSTLVFSPEETLEKKMILDACSFDFNGIEENEKRVPIAAAILMTIQICMQDINSLKSKTLKLIHQN